VSLQGKTCKAERISGKCEKKLNVYRTTGKLRSEAKEKTTLRGGKEI